MRWILLFLAILGLLAWNCSAQVMQRASLTSSRYVDAIWEFDTDGDVMPSVSGGVDVFFDLDSRLDIQPKGIAYQQDASGDIEPLAP